MVARAETTYKAIETSLETGDYIVFCSDGIIETANAKEEMFGFYQTYESIQKACAYLTVYRGTDRKTVRCSAGLRGRRAAGGRYDLCGSQSRSVTPSPTFSNADTLIAAGQP
jgi:hypothetical protein